MGQNVVHGDRLAGAEHDREADFLAQASVRDRYGGGAHKGAPRSAGPTVLKSLWRESWGYDLRSLQTYLALITAEVPPTGVG